MSDLDHRPGVREANLVIRHLKLTGLNDSNKAQLTAKIDETFGVDMVSIEADILNVAYDATHCDIDGIEAIIKQHDADISHDWWTNIKHGYYQFVDENVKDNAKHDPLCCNRPPTKK